MGGSERRAREDAVSVCSRQKLARYYSYGEKFVEGSMEKKKIDSHFFLWIPAFFRLAVSAMIAMLLRLLQFGIRATYCTYRLP